MHDSPPRLTAWNLLSTSRNKCKLLRLWNTLKLMRSTLERWWASQPALRARFSSRWKTRRKQSSSFSKTWLISTWRVSFWEKVWFVWFRVCSAGLKVHQAPVGLLLTWLRNYSTLEMEIASLHSTILTKSVCIWFYSRQSRTTHSIDWN
jgi:hypothetical protein